MKLTYIKIAIFVLVAGLLTACGSQTKNTSDPVSQPTEAVAPAISSPLATQAAANPPVSTDTSTPVTEPAAAPQGAPVSFSHDVLPILESRCTNCHGGERTEKGLSLKTYTDMMQGSENGPIVAAGNAADSKLVELILNQKMPKRGPKLTPPQVQLITNWVNQGALNN